MAELEHGFEQYVQARAHNALLEALAGEFMSLSQRDRLAAAVVAAVEPVIRDSERDRCVTVTDPPGGEPLTHYWHCWRFPRHHACAVALIERQSREYDDLLVRTDRA